MTGVHAIGSRTARRRAQIQMATLIEVYRERLSQVTSRGEVSLEAAELAWRLDELLATYRARWAS